MLFVYGIEHFRVRLVYGVFQWQSVGDTVVLPDVFVCGGGVADFTAFLANDGGVAVRSGGGSFVLCNGGLFL